VQIFMPRTAAAMADCRFPAQRRPVDAGMTSQVARPLMVPLRPGKGAADRSPLLLAPQRHGSSHPRRFRFHVRFRLLATRSAANKAQPRG